MDIGGQFLRAYVEAFNDPPVANLITYVDVIYPFLSNETLR